MRHIFKMMLWCVVTVIIYGCARRDKVEIVRLDRAAAEGEMITAENSDGIRLWQSYCGTSGEDTDTFWREYGESDAVKVFYPDVVERIDAALPAVETDLGKVKERLSREFPEVTFPDAIYGVVSPYMQGIMLSDTLMLIALNHYLGADYPGYEGMTAEQRILKSAQNIKNDVAEALLRTNFPFSGNDWSPVLSKIAYEGAIAAGVREVTDCTAAEAVGISSDNYRLLEDNEKNIWKKMIESQLLYNTSPRISDGLIKPYPGKRFPSRAGKYFGYKVAECALGNGISLKELLSSDFYMSEDVLKCYR